MRRRARQPPPDLTSLFDVLFIVIFAALIRAAAVQQAAAQPPPTPKPPEPKPQPMDPRSLQARALAAIDKQLAARPVIVVRVATATKTVTAIENDGKTVALDVPLVEASPDPNIEAKYLGDRSAELRLCRIVAVHLNVPDLARYLVVIAPDARPRFESLKTGLERDVERCILEQRGLAVIVPP